MKNPTTFYVLIGLGIIGLIAGVMFLIGVAGTHHTLPYIAFVGGALLLIVGIVGMFMARSKAVAK